MVLSISAGPRLGTAAVIACSESQKQFSKTISARRLAAALMSRCRTGPKDVASLRTGKLLLFSTWRRPAYKTDAATRRFIASSLIQPSCWPVRMFLKAFGPKSWMALIGATKLIGRNDGSSDAAAHPDRCHRRCVVGLRTGRERLVQKLRNRPARFVSKCPIKVRAKITAGQSRGTDGVVSRSVLFAFGWGTAD